MTEGKMKDMKDWEQARDEAADAYYKWCDAVEKNYKTTSQSLDDVTQILKKEREENAKLKTELEKCVKAERAKSQKLLEELEDMVFLVDDLIKRNISLSELDSFTTKIARAAIAAYKGEE